MKSFLRKIRNRLIVTNITIPKSSLVLDTSCQDGSFLLEIIKNNSNASLEIHGVDINAQVIYQAQKNIPSGFFSVVSQDILSLPYQDKTFDVVISSLTLHHMKNPKQVFLEMKRVLKEGGVIYLIDIIAEKKWFDKILKKTKCPEPYHFEKFYSFQEVQNMVSDIGFVIDYKKKLHIYPTYSLISPVLVLGLHHKYS